MTVAYAAMPAGALLAGLLATTFGTRTALWVLTALISASGLLYLPTPIRRLRDLPLDRPASGKSDSAIRNDGVVTVKLASTHPAAREDATGWDESEWGGRVSQPSG